MSAREDYVMDRHQEHKFLHGIAVSFTKRRIEKYQQKLGNGRDAELHGTVADLYQHLGEKSLALESYQAAVTSLLQNGRPLEVEESDRLIALYKKILTIEPLYGTIGQDLGVEYLRRGFEYRALELFSSLAERFAKQGDYRKAVDLYQQVFSIEPGSIRARQTCADLLLKLGQKQAAAHEYQQIAEIYFEHQRFDGALEYYKEALRLDGQNMALQQRSEMVQQILDGVVLPYTQAEWQTLKSMSQTDLSQRRSLKEQERVEQALRSKIEELKQRYEESVTEKNRQLRDTTQRLEDLSTYVAVFKDNLEQVAREKARLQTLLEQELQHKEELQERIDSLSAFRVEASCQHSVTTHSLQQQERLESAVKRLRQEQKRLKRQLQEKLSQSARREDELQKHLEQRNAEGIQLERKLQNVGRERDQVERHLQHQLQESLHREHILRDQMNVLSGRHELALKHITQEKRQLEEKYRVTQKQINVVEADTMSTLEQLHGELSRQCELESHFSEQFHESLQEISLLLHTQEQEIQKLEQL